MTPKPHLTSMIDPSESLTPVGELSRRLAAELMSAAAVCRDCEHIAGDLAKGGAALESISRLQALDELTQRLHGLSDVLQRIGQHASGEWSISIEPLLEGLGLADLVVRLRAVDEPAAQGVEAGELDFF
ncbi:hypothetical protein [Caulobacter henricii]|uniref:Chemotaxis protein CheU n=1 Tax=Caulobacter henricii TaxID=69395 RepID=A0A0P0NW74_9CAUL|nr:chemotaxis protein CheU [Caulobacter henricii]